jgi:hypothetical protein
VIFTTPGDWVLKPVEVPRDIDLGHNVDGDYMAECLLFAPGVYVGEGVNGANGLTKAVGVGIALGLVGVATVLCVPSFFNFLEGVAIGDGVELACPSCYGTQGSLSRAPWLVVAAVARVVADVGNEFHAAVGVALAGVASVAVTELAVPVIGPRGLAPSTELVVGASCE